MCPLGALLPQPFHHPVCPLSYPAAKRATAGPPAVRPQEAVLLKATPTIYKRLPEHGADTEEVPDVHTLAGTPVWRLQAEVRLKDCKDGRSPGSHVDTHYSLSTKSTTATISLSAIEWWGVCCKELKDHSDYC